MPRNDAAAPGHVCPGIRIHAIDIVQPPGIGIPPIAVMDPHQTIVTAVLAAKSSAETLKKARSETMAREISRPSTRSLRGRKLATGNTGGRGFCQPTLPAVPA